ncbi:MAG: type II secretion system F family protein [SAR202 cluster bacterium]|nr:type II secretion system F family protein [SAR202 cluster bacterium]
MVVRYVAYTWQGEKVEGVLNVDREDVAREMLQKDDLIPYEVVRVRPIPSLSRFAPMLFQPKPQEVIEFTRGLAALIRSGIPIREGLTILRGQGVGLGMKEIVRQLIAAIEDGSRLSDACARHPRVFSGFYIRLLRVGEATGRMPESLQQLAETLLKGKAMRDKVKGALVYPAISMVVAILVAVILLVYSLPAIVNLLAEFGGELPLATRLLIEVSEFVQAYKMVIFIVLATVLVGSWLTSKTVRGRRVMDRYFLKFPIIGSVLMQSNLFNLTSTFGTLLRSGIPSMEALRLSKDSLGNVILRERLDDIINDVEGGTRLGSSFREYWPSPPLLSQGMITGEATGNLPEALNNMAEYYEQEATRTVSGATELIQPAVILLVAGLVGFVAIAVVGGVYSALDSIE